MNITETEYMNYMDLLKREIIDLKFKINDLYVCLRDNKGGLTKEEINDLIKSFKERQIIDFKQWNKLNMPEGGTNGFDRIYNNTEVARIKKYIK